MPHGRGGRDEWPAREGRGKEKKIFVGSPEGEKP